MSGWVNYSVGGGSSCLLLTSALTSSRSSLNAPCLLWGERDHPPSRMLQSPANSRELLQASGGGERRQRIKAKESRRDRKRNGRLSLQTQLQNFSEETGPRKEAPVTNHTMCFFFFVSCRHHHHPGITVLLSEEKHNYLGPKTGEKCASYPARYQTFATYCPGVGPWQ